MRPIKLAARVLPMSSAARMLIMDEPDELPMSVYCIKVGTWFKLLRTARD